MFARRAMMFSMSIVFVGCGMCDEHKAAPKSLTQSSRAPEGRTAKSALSTPVDVTLFANRLESADDGEVVACGGPFVAFSGLSLEDSVGSFEKVGDTFLEFADGFNHSLQGDPLPRGSTCDSQTAKSALATCRITYPVNDEMLLRHIEDEPTQDVAKELVNHIDEIGFVIQFYNREKVYRDRTTRLICLKERGAWQQLPEPAD